MATAVKQRTPPETQRPKPNIPPKPHGLRSSSAEKSGAASASAAPSVKRSRIAPPSEQPPPPPVGQSSRAITKNPESVSAGAVEGEVASTSGQSKPPSGGIQVKRSHSTAAETSSGVDKGVKVKRHHSVREGKDSSIEVLSDDDKNKGPSQISQSSRRKRSDGGDDDLQTRMRDCFWTPLASFVVKTKAGGAALVEKGSKKLFGRGLPPRKKSKRPAPSPPVKENGSPTIRSRPQVPPRPLLKLLLQSIKQKEEGVWHKLDHVKYIDEEVSTEDSTDYTDVDWGKALATDDGDEDIIYYTYIEEAPNQKVIFYQRVNQAQCYSSDEQDVSLDLEDIPSVPHVAEMENMEIETEPQNPVLPQNDPISDPSAVRTGAVLEEQQVRLVDECESVPFSDTDLITPIDGVSSQTNGDSRIDVGGDENANVIVGEDKIDIKESEQNEQVSPDQINGIADPVSGNLTPVTRKKSPQYAFIQKSGTPEQLVIVEPVRPATSGLNEGYYDLDVQAVKPARPKPKRPPLPVRKPPSRPAPPVPPKTYLSLRFPPEKQETAMEVEEEKPVSEEKLEAEAVAQPSVNVVITEAEVLFEEDKDQMEVVEESKNIVEHKSDEVEPPAGDVKEMAVCEEPIVNMNVGELENDQIIKDDVEAVSVVTESIAETVPDDISERPSHWADSEMSLERPLPHWDSRSVSVPLSMTSESGFLSSPTPPPRHRKLRHHSVEGVIRNGRRKFTEAESRRSKSCSDAELARKCADTPDLATQTEGLRRDASTNTRPQRPPRPAPKPKPERPPKPFPPAVRKLVYPSAFKEETNSLADADAVSFTSSSEGSPKMTRMKSRPLPPPPAPPRQRSPRPPKKSFLLTETTPPPVSASVTPPPRFSSETPPPPVPVSEKETTETEPTVRPIVSSFPVEFLNKLSEIEAGRLNISEIKVQRIHVAEIDASIIRVGDLHVGQIILQTRR